LGGDKMWILLGEIGQKILAYEDGMRKKLDLSEAEYKGLKSIENKEKITCQEFSKRMRLSLSRGSRVVDRLFHKKFIERIDCPTDRRCKNVWLTKKGALIRKKIKREIKKWESALTADYSEKKFEQLRNDLEKIARKL
jgi:DNA-binding MarR family transcriptional regulator